MGDSSRRRGSMHDILDDDLPPYTDRGRYREYSDLPHNNNISRHRDHSRWSSGEKKDGSILKDKIDIAETREQLHNSSHYRSMSPGLDKQWSQSRRGLEKNRSRSPGWSRSRSHVRDRSPFYDQGPESHRKIERGRSSQTLDSDIDGRRKYKQEPKYHYDKGVDEFSDSYQRNNESSQSRSRGSVTCRDFVKGNCRYGESCRFSHIVENENVDRSFRNEGGRSLCKFFLAGNCRRDNCRFSHDTPLSSEHEDRIHDNIGESEKPANTRRISRWGARVDADMDLSEDVFVVRRGDERLGYEYPRSPSVDEMSPHMPSHNLSPPPANPQVFITSATHQYQGVDPEIRSAYRDNSSVLNMKGQQMMSPTSNALKVDLNEFGHGAYSSFPVQARNDQFAPLNTFPVSVSNDQNIQTAHVAKVFLEELKTQLHTVSQPAMSLDQHPPLKNVTIAVNDQMARELLSSSSVINPQLSTLHQSGDLKVEGNDDSKENQLETNDDGGKLNMNSKVEADNNCSNIGEEQGKEGGNNHKDEKVMRLFKISLVELVKDILKPKWKEGKMSREVHKNVVKKTVDKVTVTIQPEHVPKTQEKVEQYLSSNRPKISKLVQAYVERSLKAGS